jgi:hypothetical protein
MPSTQSTIGSLASLRTGWSYDLDSPIDTSLDIGKKKYAFNFLAEE